MAPYSGLEQLGPRRGLGSGRDFGHHGFYRFASASTPAGTVGMAAGAGRIMVMVYGYWPYYGYGDYGYYAGDYGVDDGDYGSTVGYATPVGA